MRHHSQHRVDHCRKLIGLLVGVFVAQASGAGAIAEASEAGAETKASSTAEPIPVPRITFAVAGMAATAAVVGAVFGIKALNEKAAFDGGDRTTRRVEDIERNALVSDIAFGAALALGVSALVLYLGKDDQASKMGSASTGLVGFSLCPIRISAGGGGAAAFRF